MVNEFYVDNPKYKSQQELKNAKKKEFRSKAGLHEDFVDIKDRNKDPSLNYVEKPNIATKRDLD